MEDEGHFPGLYYLADNAALMVRTAMADPRKFEVRRLLADGSCQNVIVRDVDFRGGTFAISATGDDTRHLLIEGCFW